MGVQILLRKHDFDNPFRRALSELLAIEGDRLYLSTGYATNVLFNQYNKQEFVGCLKKGISAGGSITVIGGMFNNTSSKKDFEDFLNNLSAELKGSNILLNFHQANNIQWHSKVALKVKNGKPVLGIVGSSNLTGPAFSLPNKQKRGHWAFNHEADVFIWNASALRKLHYKGIQNIIIPEEDVKNERSMLIDELIEIIRAELTKIDINQERKVNKGIVTDIACTNLVELKEYIVKELKISEQNILFDYIKHISDCNKLMSNASNGEIRMNVVTDVSIKASIQQRILNDLLDEIEDSVKLCTTLVKPYNSMYSL